MLQMLRYLYLSVGKAHKFWYIVFSFSFSLKHFLKLTLNCLDSCYLTLYYLVSKYLGIFQRLSLTDFQFNSCKVKKCCLHDMNFFLIHWVVAQNIVCLGKCCVCTLGSWSYNTGHWYSVHFFPNICSPCFMLNSVYFHVFKFTAVSAILIFPLPHECMFYLIHYNFHISI